MSQNILIKNGHIIDGTGKAKYKGDILISNEKIEKIGELKNESADRTIDADGLVVAPGFIDVHSHLDFILPSTQRVDVLETWIRQGVTTIVSGNCGYSPAPINHEYEDLISTYWNFALPYDGISYEWNSMADFLNYLENQGQAVNVVMLTGHNTLRTDVMGFHARFANSEEINQMKKLLKESIEAGSFGLSFGLGYVPGMYSNTDELIELASVLTKYGLPIVPHTRGLFSKLYADAVNEMIQVAEKNNIPLQISHHAGGGIGRIRKKSLQLVQEAIDRGVKVSHDNIPWAVSSTTSLAWLPPWLFDGGINIDLLKKPEIRNQVKDEMLTFKLKWPPWENKYWVDRDFNAAAVLAGFRTEKNKKYENMRLKDIAGDLNKEPIDAFLDLIIEEEGKIYTLSGQFDNPMAEDFVYELLSDPNCSIGTDIVGAGLNTISPAAYANFTKVLGQIAIEKGIMTQEEAVRKMTSLPAQQMQIKERGIIKEGAFADITIFNSNKIIGQASYTNPYQPSKGIEYVIINGKITLEKDKFYPEILVGRVLRSN
ncbi:MAG: amidohydrolase family protein [Candidatus Hermodarchaeota archaeon]